MKLEIPGQLSGPECRSVMKAAIAVRRRLEPIVLSASSSKVAKLVLILRVSGSLGDWGGDGPEEPTYERKDMVCEVLIPDHDWASCTAEQTHSVVGEYVLRGLQRCADESQDVASILAEAKDALLNPGRA